NRSHVDAAGVLHEWDDELIGEAWDSGPLILSWADVEVDLDDPHAGFCVAVHEMAHKLDALDGVLDGTPPLPRDWQRAWARDFQEAYDGFVARVDAGGEVAIDPYAAEAPEEFFAVCSEYHFSQPALLRDGFPQVAAHFERCCGSSRSQGCAPPDWGDGARQARRQAHLEPRSAELIGSAHVQLAAVAAHDVLHDRQPDPVALHALVAAHPALE